jgi:hypothetical protein
MLWKLLRQDWSETALGEAFARLKIAREIRAEALGVQQWAALTAMLTSREESRA